MIAHWSQAGYETAMVCGNLYKKGSLYKYGKRVKKIVSSAEKNCDGIVFVKKGMTNLTSQLKYF